MRNQEKVRRSVDISIIFPARLMSALLIAPIRKERSRYADAQNAILMARAPLLEFSAIRHRGGMKKTSLVRQVERIIERVGLITHFTILGYAPVMERSLKMLRAIFKSSVINTTAIYPRMPRVGKRVRIRIILITESTIFTRIQYSC